MNPNDYDQERNLFRFLMANMPDRIYFKDRQSRFICVNAAMARLFNLDGPGQAVGKSDFDFFPKVDAQRMFDDEQRVLDSGEPIVGKVEKKVLPDGSVGWTLTTKLLLRDDSGQAIGTCGISRDISELKAAEAALEQEKNRLKQANADLARSQAVLERKHAELEKTHADLKAAQARIIEAEKAQSVGRLALGVAHEVKNPLAVVKMGVDYLSAQAGGAGAEVLHEMSNAVNRADSIINELMIFSASSELKTVPVQVQEVVEKALAPLETALSATKIRVIKQYGSGLPAVRLDMEKIEHVFASLIENAADAMCEGGTLSIRIGLTHLAGPETMMEPGGRSIVHSGIRRIGVVTEISDTGGGIPPEKLTGVFDPFFTTKATGKGTGLGLTVSRKIIELHGGTIDLANRSEGGVCARVLLKV